MRAPKGARIVALGDPRARARHDARALAADARSSASTTTMAVMREEIFGPLLPVETYADARRRDRQDQRAPASARVLLLRPATAPRVRQRAARRRSPAASPSTIRCGISRTKDLPFGGVGASGTGAYHGEARLSHVLAQRSPCSCSRASPRRGLLYPPYGARVRPGARAAQATQRLIAAASATKQQPRRRRAAPRRPARDHHEAPRGGDDLRRCGPGRSLRRGRRAGRESPAAVSLVSPDVSSAA